MIHANYKCDDPRRFHPAFYAVNNQRSCCSSRRARVSIGVRKEKEKKKREKKGDKNSIDPPLWKHLPKLYNP